MVGLRRQNRFGRRQIYFKMVFVFLGAFFVCFVDSKSIWKIRGIDFTSQISIEDEHRFLMSWTRRGRIKSRRLQLSKWNFAVENMSKFEIYIIPSSEHK